ncbi:protein SEC13 homolog isoform X2 [Varroa jacobsoni]|uniref:protein SEC13 homolog isoform X2 n=2 Tax=Varroa jacobsoni TaxID=62625 RepID=UPI000BF5250A|nr:protein SEC13 homolog isoform X2 [Varroa jacobsoni]
MVLSQQVEQVEHTHTVDTSHEDMVHDAQTDAYGLYLATCSSDKKVKVFDISDNKKPLLIKTLEGHEGPVWQVAWAHPTFGTILATCSYDKTVIVWKKGPTPDDWTNIFTYKEHTSSVNSINWAPHEFGLILAAGSSDMTASVHTCITETRWESVKIEAHNVGCNAVSWAPALQNRRFVTGGCDNLVKIWKLDEEAHKWINEHTLEGHTDWVRDVAWAPCLGQGRNIIASCGQDCRVIIWTQERDQWRRKELSRFRDVVWLVSWAITGNVLAVSGGDNNVSLWTERENGEWDTFSEVNNVPMPQPLPPTSLVRSSHQLAAAKQLDAD